MKPITNVSVKNKLQEFMKEIELDETDASKLKKAIEEYKAQDNVKIYQKDQDTYAYFVKLNDDVAKDLAHSFEAFTDGKAIDKYRKEAMDTMINFTKEVLSEEFPNKNFKVDARIREQDTHVGQDAAAGYIIIGYKGEEIEIELSSLYYNMDLGAHLYYSQKTWNWAFWLGNPDSPFYDYVWEQDYITTELHHGLSEMTSYLGEGDAASEIIKAAKKLVSE